MPEDFVQSLWNPESYLKFLILLLTYPVWGPILKVMWREIQDALAPEGGVFGKQERRAIARRQPGMDPWVKVPLARTRRRGAPPASGPPAGRGGAGPRRGAPPPRLARRRGF